MPPDVRGWPVSATRSRRPRPLAHSRTVARAQGARPQPGAGAEGAHQRPARPPRGSPPRSRAEWRAVVTSHSDVTSKEHTREANCTGHTKDTFRCENRKGRVTLSNLSGAPCGWVGAGCGSGAPGKGGLMVRHLRVLRGSRTCGSGQTGGDWSLAGPEWDGSAGGRMSSHPEAPHLLAGGPALMVVLPDERVQDEALSPSLSAAWVGRPPEGESPWGRRAHERSSWTARRSACYGGSFHDLSQRDR